MKQKPDIKDSMSGFTMDIKASQNTNDISTILMKRISGIQEEMGKFSKNINEFTGTCDSELNTLVGNISML